MNKYKEITKTKEPKIKYNKNNELLSIPPIQYNNGYNSKTSIIKPWLPLSIKKELEDKPHNKGNGINEKI